MVDYPPYVDSYGQIKELLKKIKEAAVPPKFTQDFVSMVLGLKSSSFRPMIPLLKRIRFIDENNVPTQHYIDFRDESKAGGVMAYAVKIAYPELFSANEYAHKLPKDQVIAKLVSVLGTSKDDKVVPKVAATFLEFCNFADFEGNNVSASSNGAKSENPPQPTLTSNIPLQPQTAKLGISYTINLNLPATPDIEVFDAIFKSLKEHLLK